MSLIDQLIEELKNNPQKLEEFFTLFKDKFITLALGEINRKIDILLRDREEIFKRFEEHDKKFEEIIKRLEEHDKKFVEIMQKLEEHDRKFEEITKKLEEHDRKFEEIMKRLEEHDKKFVEVMNRLEEHDKKFIQLMEEIKAIRLEMRRMNKRIGTLEINLGFLTESFAIDFFTRYLNEKVISITKHYQIDNKEIDAMIETENKYFLVEVKSRVSPQDVVQMYSLVNKFLKEAKKEVRPTILGVRVKNEAIEVGKKLGIDVIRI